MGGERGAQADGAADLVLDEATIADLQDGIAAGRWSSRQLTEAYLLRIAALDRDGPSLHAIIETNPDALTIAESLDAERLGGQSRGPLHGIPVLLKDNIGTADRTTTTAGSLALRGSTPSRDAFLVTRLREAGAVLLGKANLSEWANFRSTQSSSGWSARGGQCRNPYVLDRSPCGSSSGSAVAVSANLVTVAVGTETAGSIVCPSAINGVVGVKPTVGLVSRSGLIPISHVQDTAGPIARTVRDAAVLLGALAGVDPGDAATAAPPDWRPSELADGLDAGALRGARIGVARSLFGTDRSTNAVAETALAALRDAGAELIDPVEVPGWQVLGAPAFEALLYELKAGLEAYLAGLGDGVPVRTLADLIAFNEAHRREELPFFEQELLQMADERGPLTTPAYRLARDWASRLARDGLDAALADHRLDAIVATTTEPAWLTDHIMGDPDVTRSDAAAAVAGYPNVTVPAGRVGELPVGLSFFGPAWSEPRLLSLAYAFEQATGHRRPPSFLESIAPGTGD